MLKYWPVVTTVNLACAPKITY